MLIAHKIALDPTNKQQTYFARSAGTARFAYNWALAEWKRLALARKDDPTLPETLNDWPQALRCQPVERGALARRQTMNIDNMREDVYK